MEYRILGRTGLKVSVLGIGTWQLSGPVTVEGRPDGFPDPGCDKVIDLIRACADLGINVIDSAEIYGEGEGERRVGEALRGTRNQWILVTKFGMRKGANGERVVDTRPGTIRQSLEDSLKRLHTNYVDVYLYHAPPSIDSIIEGRGTLERLKQEGKIRFYGISTNDYKVVGQMLTHNAADVVMLSQSLLTHPFRLLNLARKHNFGVMVRGAFEGGRLSGKYFHRKPEFSDQDMRKQAFQAMDFHKYAVYERFLPEDITMDAFALRYLMDFSTTHTIVLGGSSIEHYRNALRALDLCPLDLKTRAAAAIEEARYQLGGQSRNRRILHWLSRKVFGTRK
ncbi:MAG: aldo/keto reductase [Nitrospiraceae bacterium]|nr:aldo/keto reductase [Nitrospiraceae bacterium]